MSTQKYQNYIAGEWVDGAATSNDINPSDTSDVVAEYAQADKKPYQFAIGRELEELDDCTIDDLERALSGTDGSYQELLVALARHPVFAFVRRE